VEVLRVADGHVLGRLTPPGKRSLRAMWATVKEEGGRQGGMEEGVRLLMVDEAETLVLKDGKDQTGAFWAKGGREGGREGMQKALLNRLRLFFRRSYILSTPSSLLPS